MKRLIFFLEEPSAEEMLKAVLAKLSPDHVHAEFKVFEGKQDLEKGLPRTLRAWRVPDCTFVVIRDQDSGFLNYIADVGLNPGVKLKVRSRNCSAESVQVAIGDKELSLGLGAAAKVMVR